MTIDQNPRLVRFQDGRSLTSGVTFDCPHCEEQILVSARSGIGEKVECPNCARSVDVPPVPCFHECGGFYERCGGELRSEKVPDRFTDWETTCVKCGAIRNLWVKAGSTCDRIACNHCNRELPSARDLPEL